MTERDTHSPDDPVRRDDHPGDGAARGTARMEAFADGVFAIALTLPVVEIALPDGGAGGRRLGADLLALWPHYLGYALSVLVIGLYWVQHHFSGAIYRTTGHMFLLATTLFLATIGFIAFPTRVFAESLAEPGARQDAARYYAVCLALTAIAWFVKWRTGRVRGHVDARLEPAYVDRLDARYRASAVLAVVAAALTFVSWEVGLGLMAIAILVYLRPPETPIYVAEAPAVEGE